jgi:hypothetical protein
MSMNNLIAFYNGDMVHPDGYTMDEILAMDDYWLEVKHNYIQWLFPLKQPSGAVPGSPIITDREVELFRANSELKRKLKLSFLRMLKFYGFTLPFDSDNHPFVIKAPNFDTRKSGWLTPQNHNFRRISRILESLTLLGLPEVASMFFAALRELYQDDSSVIGWTTYNYWEQAVES